MPVINDPQKIYDGESSPRAPFVFPLLPDLPCPAFVDTSRSGPLPSNITKGTMPLYFPMNRKYLDGYRKSHYDTAGFNPEPKQSWDFLPHAKVGPYAAAAERQHGRMMKRDRDVIVNSPALEDRRDYHTGEQTEYSPNIVGIGLHPTLLTLL